MVALTKTNTFNMYNVGVMPTVSEVDILCVYDA